MAGLKGTIGFYLLIGFPESNLSGRPQADSRAALLPAASAPAGERFLRNFGFGVRLESPGFRV